MKGKELEERLKNIEDSIANLELALQRAEESADIARADTDCLLKRINDLEFMLGDLARGLCRLGRSLETSWTVKQ
ncbi:MAG: hypothetical protein QXI19_02155 [Candidatus Caldarchaeum sp.]